MRAALLLSVLGTTTGVPLASRGSALRELSPPQDTLPEGWQVRGRSPPETSIELTFALKQQRLEDLYAALDSVSDPTSASYGKHWSGAAVHDLVKPDAAHLDAVHSFITNATGRRAFEATPNGDMLGIVVTVAEAERLLDAEYVELEHISSGVRDVHRCLASGHRVPEHVAAAVDFVGPTTHVPGVRRTSAQLRSTTPSGSALRAKHQSGSGQQRQQHGGSSPHQSGNGQQRQQQQHGNVQHEWGDDPTHDPKHEALATFDNNVTNLPETLRTLYSVTAEGKARGNSMAVTGFLGQYFEPTSLHTHWSKYCTGTLHCGPSSREIKVVGDATKRDDDWEASMDVEVRALESARRLLSASLPPSLAFSRLLSPSLTISRLLSPPLTCSRLLSPSLACSRLLSPAPASSQAITGIAGNIDTEFWGFSGQSDAHIGAQTIAQEPFLKFLHALSRADDATVPKVFSTSYGEDESSWPKEAAARLNSEFAKAGLRGISLLWASGDRGANCRKGVVPGKGKQLEVVGPGASPYVLIALMVS